MGHISFVALCITLLITDSMQSPTKDLGFLQDYYLRSAPNKVAVCGHGKCRGSLWGPQWVFTTVDCVNELPVTVYHLHNEDFDCSNDTDVDDAEKRSVEKIFKHPMSQKQNLFDIAFMRLESPYDNVSHMNFTQKNETMEYFLFETWITDVIEEHAYEPSRTEATPGDVRAQLARRDLGRPVTRKAPALKVFATIVLLPFFTFVVFYLVISFFSRSPPQCHRVARGYYMFGKHNGYEDTNI